MQKKLRSNLWISRFDSSITMVVEVMFNPRGFGLASTYTCLATLL